MRRFGARFSEKPWKELSLRAMADREREIKLVANSAEALEAFARIPELAGFALTPPETRDQEDLYLDTAEFHLFAAGTSLRYRRRAGVRKATLKEIP